MSITDFHDIDTVDVEQMSDTPAMERGAYPIFHRAFIANRLPYLSRTVDLTHLELPTNSTLHLIDNFLDQENPDISPNVNGPLLRNEHFTAMMMSQVALPPYPVYAKDGSLDMEKTEHPFYLSPRDRFVYNPGRYKTITENFYRTHKSVKRKKILSEDTTAAQTNVLMAIDYNPLLKAKFSGSRLRNWKQFDLLLRAILNNVSRFDTRYHFIQIPMSDHLYKREQVIRPFTKADTSTLLIHDDPSYFFMVHLLGFVAGAETSLLRQLPPNIQDLTNFVMVTPDGHALIYNLGDLRQMNDRQGQERLITNNALRAINELKLRSVTAAHDELSALPDEAFNDVVEKTARTDAESEDAPAAAADKKTVQNVVEKALPTIGTAKVTSVKDTSSARLLTESDFAPLLSEKLLREESDSTTRPMIGIPTAKKPVPVSKRPPIIEVARDQLKDVIKTRVEDPASVTARIDQLHDRHMAVEIGGKPIRELIAPQEYPALESSNLDFLKDMVPDKSMLTSSVAIDRLYIEHMMQRDLAAVLTAFTGQGFYVTNVIERDVITSMDRTRNYRVDLTDVTGKRHGIDFSLPIVDKEGVVLSGGIKRRLSKQMTNLPICKVSERRVNLASSFNKYLVERNAMKAFSYTTFLANSILQLKKAGILNVSLGHYEPQLPLPYDYVLLADNYRLLEYPGEGSVFFNYDTRFEGVEKRALLEELEKKYGVYMGKYANGDVLFMDMQSQLTRVRPAKNGVALQVGTIADFLSEIQKALPADAKKIKVNQEFVDLKILDGSFPVILVLSYRYGLKTILDYIGLEYRFHPSEEGGKIDIATTDIVVPFADGKLVFNRYPLQKSLIAAGLLRYRTKEYFFDMWNGQDAYYQILADHDISTNFLKGFDDFFDLFIDPITRDVLYDMGEPTNCRDLLIRATEMLSTGFAHPANSMRNHRIRGYERFPAAVYRELAMAVKAYNAKRGTRKTLSINTSAVFLGIMTDPSMGIVEEINPVDDIQGKAAFTYTGKGGRTAATLVIEDRVYSKDAVGIVSERTPDSGKVAVNAYLSADPLIKNIRGIFHTDRPEDMKLSPTQMLSPSALLIPGATNDDWSTDLNTVVA